MTWLQLGFHCLLVDLLLSCAPSAPTVQPSLTTTTTDTPTTTTTAMPCCSLTIYDPIQYGRALFDPALKMCSDSTRFICSVSNETNNNPVEIRLNHMSPIEMASDGQTIQVTITCRRSDTQWIYNGEIVNDLQCFQEGNMVPIAPVQQRGFG